MNHRYTLEPYRGRYSRITCPNCHHRTRTFTRYIDTETRQPLADHVGKCDRLDGCGYHYPPREYFAATPGARPVNSQAQLMQAALSHYNLLPWKLVEQSMKAFDRNHFVQFLTRLFGAHEAKELVLKYCIGTASHWRGATVFWQIDRNDNVRTGKIMLYNRTDGHRVKQPFNHISWVHTLLMRNANCQMRNEDFKKTSAIGIPTSDFNLKQCFFGEHLLLTDPFKTVAIAESEKTAIIASFFYPKYIWLACGSLEGLSRDKCKVLADRRVILYPDVNGFEKWRLKSREMNLRLPGAHFSVDDTLERIATGEQRAKGIDIADIWIEQLNNKT